MIQKTKQKWDIGNTVKVGFLSLIVTGIESIKDGLPDIYYLQNQNGDKKYKFIPHNGLTRIS